MHLWQAPSPPPRPAPIKGAGVESRGYLERAGYLEMPIAPCPEIEGIASLVQHPDATPRLHASDHRDRQSRKLALALRRQREQELEILAAGQHGRHPLRILFFVLLLAASAFAATAGETVLYSFAGGNSGSNPYAGLVADAAGNLYGTTGGGGSSTKCSLGSGCGTVFMLAPPSGTTTTWTETVLYNFQGATVKDGSGPQAGLIFDAKGALYGTTSSGGASGDGTVFKLTPAAIKRQFPATMLPYGVVSRRGRCTSASPADRKMR